MISTTKTQSAQRRTCERRRLTCLLLCGLCVFVVSSLSLTQEDREAIRKTHAAVHKSFVGLDVTLRKKTRLEKAELEEEALDAEAQRLVQLMENEQPLETWGVAIDKDLILVADRGFKESDVQKIEATDAAGARFEVKLAGVGRRHDFVLLKPAAPRELVPLAFSDWKAPALGEGFHITYAERVDDRWHLNVSPYIQTNAPLAAGGDWFCIDLLRTGSVISDKDGSTVGVALDQYLWTRPDGSSSFLGKAILADERMTDLDARYAAFRKALPGAVKRIEITFRAEKGTDRFMPGEDAKPGRTTLYGVALDEKGTLFVPEGLARELVRKIEDIRVTDGGRVIPGAFVGLFRSFGGMLVRAEGLTTAPGLAVDAAAVPPGQIFFTAAFEDRFGSDRITLDYNRLFRVERGLGGAPRVQARRRVKTGAFLLDFDGRIVGCATSDKKEEDLDDVAMESSRERYYMERYRGGNTPEHLRRILFFSEIRDALAKPAAHFDFKAVPMTKKEAGRLVWLGIEFQEVSKPVAEALGIQGSEQTNDGRRGLIVTEIYVNSPAARAGLRQDDVLLSVKPEGDASRDLAAEADRFAGYAGRPPGFGGRSAAPPWKPTRNYLTTLLTEIGAAKKVSFDVLRGKEKRSVGLTLELAPVDYESAERYKDDALALTVKELTYEVRHFYKLEPEATGVVVARVESGGKADVAKLQPLSVVSRVNNVAVRDLAHFRELLRSAKGLTLTTVSYGQTKLVELERE